MENKVIVWYDWMEGFCLGMVDFSSARYMYNKYNLDTHVHTYQYLHK